MLKEGYLAKMNTYPKNEVKIVVTRTAKSVLAPSWNLLNDYKDGLIDWQEYERRFREEMKNPESIKEMRKIKKLAETSDVRLICYEKNYPCHRFILIDLISSMETEK